VRSAIYEGKVFHHRREPVDHRFAYRIALPLIDLDELEEVCARSRLWSCERPNVVSFRRADYLGCGTATLAEAVRDAVEAETGHRPGGPVAMLAHLRTWGWLFNPIALFYCFDTTGTEVESLVAEVTNTPWHERHAYVVGAPGTHRFDKQLHVSPFFGMDQRYELTYGPPEEHLAVRLGNDEGDRRVFDATLRLERREISRRSLGRVVTAYPLMTIRVSLGIYRQALALRRAGVPVVPHRGPGPGVTAREVPTIAHQVASEPQGATLASAHPKGDQ
jgi:DUF1365 family protein